MDDSASDRNEPGPSRDIMGIYIEGEYFRYFHSLVPRDLQCTRRPLKTLVAILCIGYYQYTSFLTPQ